MILTTIPIIIVVLLFAVGGAWYYFPKIWKETFRRITTGYSSDITDNLGNISIIFGTTTKISETYLGINLYYPNKIEANKSGDSCSINSVIPIYREIIKTNTPITDAINLLITGQLSDAEKKAGFSTEFPNDNFKLIGANEKGGVLSLEFTEVPGFTDEGSCRMKIITNQIIKTAEQFIGINEVRFLPKTVFQP